MLDYLKKKLEKILDPLVDPIIARFNNFSIRTKLALLFLGTAFVWLLGNPSSAEDKIISAIWTIKVSLAAPDKLASSAATMSHIQSVKRKNIPPLLSIITEKNHSDLTPWVAAEILVSIENKNQDLIGDLREYFQSTRSDAVAGWRENPNNSASPMLTNVSGWVFFALADMGVAADNRALDHLIDAQDPDGWWPLFTEAHTPKISSTYATSWAIIGLQCQLKKNLISKSRISAAEKSVEKARAWLLQTKLPGARWKNYPTSERGYVSQSISGLAVHALILSGSEASRDIASDWINSLPRQRPDFFHSDTAGLQFETQNGTVTDYYLQFSLPWMLIATIDSYFAVDHELKVVSSRWIDRAVNDEKISEIDDEKTPWKKTELLYSLIYLQSRI